MQFWTSNGSLLLPGVAIGAVGACCFFANWSPEFVADVLEHGLAGRMRDADAVQRRIVAADFLGMKYGVRALKAGLEALGYECGPPRQPMPPLGDTEAAELIEAFVEAGLLASR